MVYWQHMLHNRMIDEADFDQQKDHFLHDHEYDITTTSSSTALSRPMLTHDHVPGRRDGATTSTP